MDRLPVYFSISRTRLLLLSLLTFNLYQVYWFYRNWKYIKEVSPVFKESWPLIRAIFAFFTCIEMFLCVSESAELHHRKASFSPRYTSAMYMCTLFLFGAARTLARAYEFPHTWLLLIDIGLFISTSVILFPVQRVINEMNDKRVGFRSGEVALIIVGVLAALITILGALITDTFGTVTDIEPNFKSHFVQRAEVVQDIKAGTLHGESDRPDKIQLPFRYGNLSAGGNDVLIDQTDEELSVLFFTFRGVVDNFAGFVYKENGEPPTVNDFSCGTLLESAKYSENWYWMSCT